MRIFEKSDMIYVAVFIVATCAVAPWSYIVSDRPDMTYVQVMSDLHDKKISSLLFKGQAVYVTEGLSVHKALLPVGAALADKAIAAEVPVSVKPNISTLSILIASIVFQIIITLGIVYVWRSLTVRAQ